MSMLAEKRTKRKWCLNPNGKDWSNDDNKFGQRMLEKMGWKKGCGLGANLQGMKEHVKVSAKHDTKGLGCSNTADKEWIHHQQNFENLLSELTSTLSDGSTTTDVNNSPVSLEEKSKKSRVRVHYQKFARGKDVSKYSAADLASIFGKKGSCEYNKSFEMKVNKDYTDKSYEADSGSEFISAQQPLYSTNGKNTFIFGSSSSNSENCDAVGPENNFFVQCGYQKDSSTVDKKDIENGSENKKSDLKKNCKVEDLCDNLSGGLSVSSSSKSHNNHSKIKPKKKRVLEDYDEIRTKPDVPSSCIHASIKNNVSADFDGEGNETMKVEDQKENDDGQHHKKKKKKIHDKKEQINIMQEEEPRDGDQLAIKSSCEESKEWKSEHKKMKKKKKKSEKTLKEILPEEKNEENRCILPLKCSDVEETNNSNMDGNDKIDEKWDVEVSRQKRKKSHRDYTSSPCESEADDGDQRKAKKIKNKKYTISVAEEDGSSNALSTSTDPSSISKRSKGNKDNTHKNTECIIPTKKSILTTKAEDNLIKDRSLPKKKEDELFRKTVQAIFKGSNLHSITGYGCSRKS